MGLVAGDKRVLEAHDSAVSAVLDYYERNMVFARVQRDGVLAHEKTDNIVAAKFTHICSRVNKDNESFPSGRLDIPDPQLHTHCLIANATKCKDGIWCSIVFDKMYYHKMHLGELYRTELGHNLQRIGYELEFQKDKANRWTFEIVGVPKEDIATFSKRREKILEVAEQIESRDSESLALIAKATRQEKVSCTRDSLQENWEMRAMSLEHLRGIINLSGYHSAEKDVKSALAFSIKHLSEREAVLSKTSIIEDLLQKSASDFSIGEIEKALAAFVSEGKLLTTYRVDQNSFTTPANLKSERLVIQLMQSLLGAMRPIMDTKEIDKNIRAKGLTAGQKDAVYLALSTKLIV